MSKYKIILYGGNAKYCVYENYTYREWFMKRTGKDFIKAFEIRESPLEAYKKAVAYVKKLEQVDEMEAKRRGK